MAPLHPEQQKVAPGFSLVPGALSWGRAAQGQATWRPLLQQRLALTLLELACGNQTAITFLCLAGFTACPLCSASAFPVHIGMLPGMVFWDAS